MSPTSFLESHGFPPEGEIVPLAAVHLPVADDAHPWFVAHRAAIAENWIAEHAANPSLYDGEMVFQRHLEFADGRIEGRAHIIPFSAFLHWRKTDRGPGGVHLFGLPLVLTSDGALIAIRMGRHTANPGRVYCAAGSMDRHDIVDGACDIDVNMRREVLEETGLDLDHAEQRSGLYATHAQNTVTVFRSYRFAMTAEQMLAAIAAHVATDPDPEIDGAIAIRTADPQAHDYAFFMLPILRWLFDTGEMR
jgi:8-oxo-dGTP pyrophosphatase MutT (NUDIX family)